MWPLEFVGATAGLAKTSKSICKISDYRILASLTGIRGVAALWVMLFHLQQAAQLYFPTAPLRDAAFIGQGFRAVDLFFVLSGFILMHVHASDFRSMTAAGLRRFYLLRVFRIYPLNTFVLLVLLVIVAASPGFVAWMRQVRGPDTFSAAGFVQYLLLAQRWLMPDFGEWNNAAWTVSVEILGYLFFPVLAYRLGRTQRAAVCLGIALASLGALVAIQILIGQADMNAIGRSSILRMAGSFTAGMALCRMAALAGPVLAGQATRLTLVAAAFLLVVLLIPGLAVVAPLGFAALILGLAYGVGPIDRFLASRPVFWLGEISFSLYMIHSLPIDLASWLVVRARCQHRRPCSWPPWRCRSCWLRSL